MNTSLKSSNEIENSKIFKNSNLQIFESSNSQIVNRKPLARRSQSSIVNTFAFFFAFFFLFAGTAWGQQTLIVADQTGTSAEIPFYGLYSDDNYQHTQTIYPSNMLTAMQGGTITKLTYHLSCSVTKDYGSTYEVRLGTTTNTAFSNSSSIAYLSDANTLVYSNTLSVSGTTVDFELSTPYTYNGGNLVIDVRITTLGSGWASTSFLGESGETYYSIKNRNTSSMPTNGAGVSFMPKTTFTYLPTTPYITLSPSSATVITGFTQALTASYGNVSGSPSISYSSSNTSVATVSGSGTTATVTGVAAGTATITATMTYQGNNYTATCAITVEDPSYCTPNPSSRDGNGITALTFGSGSYVVSNSNSSGLPASSPYYADYTSMVGGYEPGETATITITYSTGSSTVYSYGTIIWVDWNKNYTFEDSEIVYTGTSVQGSGGTPQVLTATFTVPSNQAGGDYRMRVAGADSYFDSYIGGSASANHSPCFTSTYAVCHDYTLSVVSNTSCSPYAITYTYGFEDASDFNCWTKSNLETCSSNSNMGGGIYNSSSYANTGSNLFIFSSYCGETEPQYLISPELSGVVNGVHVEFDYAIAEFAGAPETFQVGYSTTDNNISSFTWSNEITCTSSESDYEHFKANFMGNVKYIAVKYTSADSYYLLLDDFSISEAPSCLEPTNVTASNISTTGARINWTAGGSETTWDLFYTNNPSTVPGSGTTPSVSGIT